MFCLVFYKAGFFCKIQVLLWWVPWFVLDARGADCIWRATHGIVSLLNCVLSHQTGRRIFYFIFGQLGLGLIEIILFFYFFLFDFSTKRHWLWSWIILKESTVLWTHRFNSWTLVNWMICQILSLWFTSDRLLSFEKKVIQLQLKVKVQNPILCIESNWLFIWFWGIWTIDCNTVCESNIYCFFIFVVLQGIWHRFILFILFILLFWSNKSRKCSLLLSKSESTNLKEITRRVWILSFIVF